MSKAIRTKLSAFLMALGKIFGSTIRDANTGEKLGKGFVLTFRGRVHLIGYEGKPVYPVFLTQKRLTYWKLSMGFAAHPEPDFANARDR